MAVERVGRFIVRRQLGRGGMGEVYCADDPVLGRPVALKVVKPSALPDRAARNRLLAEARAAAALDHPNICTIFEVGETSDDGLFIAMAFYEGETLASRLARGPMPPSEAVPVAVQIARGLAHAHAAGVVHRDVKPANVLLTRDRLVKLLDFGIALRLGEMQETGEPTVVGTLAYMSPEQLRGLADVDGRTDAWALGVTLYEMLSGRSPFDARDTSTLMQRVFFDEPQPLDGEGRTLELVLLGMLEKDASRRWTIAEFLEAVETQRPPARLEAASRVLLVLPFENLSPERDTEFFADGLTDEIITTLSSADGLKVISRRSAMRYKGSPLGVRAIAREVGARQVLEGTVRRAGVDLRITAHLVDVLTDTELWAERYVGTLDDAFDIQERVGAAIAESLRVQPASGDAPRAERALPGAVYDLYLRARAEMWRFTPPAAQRALVFIAQAHALAGDHSILLAARATALWQLVNLGGGGVSLLADAGAAAARALELDPRSVPALRVLALIAALRGDVAQADPLFARAVEFGPSDVETLLAASFFHAFAGDGDRAVQLGRRASELDPLFSLHWIGRGFAEACHGRDADAYASARRALDVDPHDPMTRIVGPLLANGRGDLDPVLRHLETTADADTATPGWYGVLAELTQAALTSRRARVRELFAPELEAFLGQAIHNAFYAAEICALVDDPARAVRFLRRAIDLGLGCYPMVAVHSRALASIRGLPEFTELLAPLETVWRRRQRP